MIVGHHGYGEELLLYAVAGGGGGAASAAFLLWRARISQVVRWLRRR